MGRGSFPGLFPLGGQGPSLFEKKINKVKKYTFSNNRNL